MELSVIIVNYNVKEFLEQCIYSVKKASKNIKTEIFVVDNSSVDGSIEMIGNLFPEINLIINDKNLGFGTACNQAIKISKGNHILILNPDTIVSENSFDVCIDFMNKNQNAGAIGVKMINGKGKFLPESKRALPTPSSAFFKIFGFSALFPSSKLFGKYQLKYLDENQIHEIEVLSGAFMFIKREALEKSGLFDEKFFMYGEDIDLSYRIIKSGYKNYYLPTTTIIHYKGESTKKSSLKYVKLFYEAMIIFAKKHYTGKKRTTYLILIQLAIYFRASFSVIKRTFDKLILPFMDISSIYLFYLWLIPFWSNFLYNYKSYYSFKFINYYVPVIILIWIISLFIYGGYKRNTKINNIIKSIIFGSLFILVVYSLLPETYRYSRALLIIGSIAMLIFSLLNRFIINLFSLNRISFSKQKKEKALIIGYEDETIFTDKLIDTLYTIDKYSANIYNNTQSFSDKIKKINELIKINKIETLIFYLKKISTSEIIQIMLETKDLNLDYKIVLPESNSIVGSKSIINAETIPELNLNIISKPLNIFLKRIVDIGFSLFFLILSPIFLLIIKNNKIFIKKVIDVLISKKTWVSYYNKSTNHTKGLPKLKKGVIFTTSPLDKTDNEIYNLNLNYAKNYKFYKDILLILKSIKLIISQNSK
ncbi:MAG: glycosyltransferase [Bacteroidales bacterium]|nr:glycosyltransferase [Bacteroidales bacterium]MBN2758510.1 glycosyltransferase [Bacteroidales bacterium]